jgi:hypothetical protein
MSEEKAPSNAGQQLLKPKQTDAEHEWNNEGGQLPITPKGLGSVVSEPREFNRQPEARSEKFKVTLSRLELISLNQGLTLWLAELRTKTDLMGESGSSEIEAIETAERLQERIDTLLGAR